MSINDGNNWQKLQGNFPVVPVYDMKIKGDEIIVGTHGRSFWILDDLTPLRQLAHLYSKKNVSHSEKVLFFQPKTTYRFTLNWSVNFFQGDGKNYSPGFGLPGTNYEETDKNGEKYFRYLDMGENPPCGVIVNYFFSTIPDLPLELIFLDDKGEKIIKFTDSESICDIKKEVDENDNQKSYLTKKLGFNRFIWDMHYPGPEVEIEKSLEKLPKKKTVSE